MFIASYLVNDLPWSYINNCWLSADLQHYLEHQIYLSWLGKQAWKAMYTLHPHALQIHIRSVTTLNKEKAGAGIHAWVSDRDVLISECATNDGSSAARHVAVTLGWEGMDLCIGRVHKQSHWTPAKLPLPDQKDSAKGKSRATEAQELLVVKHPKVSSSVHWTTQKPSNVIRSLHILLDYVDCCDCIPECSLPK